MTGLEVLDEALTNLLHNDPEHYTHEVGFVHGVLWVIQGGLVDPSCLLENISSLERSGSDTAKQSDDS